MRSVYILATMALLIHVQAHAAERPNILVIMADDWSYPHAGVLGDPAVKTPNFDRTAREGILFQNAFVSTPSCTPSRLSVLTGQHHWRLKEGASLGGSLREDYPVYTEMLAKAGYHVGQQGKGVWPSKHSFRQRDSFGKKYRNFETFLKSRKPGQPFCFWYGGKDPHRPYELGSGEAAGIPLDQIKIPACLPDHPIVRGDLADYYACVERFDRETGILLKELEAQGELDNTLVVISGDNGMPFPRAKATLYDLGTRVPLAVRWGHRLPTRRNTEDFVSLCDLAPTFLEAAGIQAPEAMTGRSLLPLLTSGQSGDTRSFVLSGMEQHCQLNPSRALRTRDFLLIRNFAPETWTLGEAAQKMPQVDFAQTPWPTGAGAFSHNIDPSPSKQFLWENREVSEVAPFARPIFGRRPEYELYDLRKDPDQLVNVIKDRPYTATRQQLQGQLRHELLKSRDPRLAVKGYRDHLIEGWVLRVSDELQKNQPEKTRVAIQLMVGQLQTLKAAVPRPALTHLQSVPLWFSPTPPGRGPKAEYHPSAGWLRNHDRNPAMAQCVEFTNIQIFTREVDRMPMVALHELAHAYHHQVLGYHHAGIKAAYQAAKDSGIYDAVPLRKTGKKRKAYAITNPQEYFAETSEAFFGINDFYPFNRQDLKKHDPRMFELLVRIWKNNPKNP